MDDEDRPNGDDPDPRGLPPAVGAVLAVVAVVLQVLRVTGTRSWQAFQAEDGAVYYQDLVQDGAVAPLLRGFAGYAQLPTRLLTLPAGLVPVEDTPLYFALVGSIVATVLGACAHRWMAGWIPSPWLRLSIVALVILSPVAGDELAANLVNTIWVFMAVAPWALVARQEGRGDVIGRSAVLFLAATASGAALVFAPLALGWALVRRTRAATIVTGAFGLGLVVQGVVMTTTDALADEVSRPLGTMAEIVGLRVSGPTLVGHEAAARLWADHGDPWLWGGLALLVALLGAAAVGAERRAVALAAALSATGVATVVALVWSRGLLPFTFLGPVQPFGASRYSYLCSVLLVAALCVLLSDRRRSPGPAVRVARALVVVHTCVVVATGFTVSGYRSVSPVWTDSLRAAAATCDAEQLPDDVSVPVQQDRDAYRSVLLPCGDVRASVGDP